jgi:hypothetical protein
MISWGSANPLEWLRMGVRAGHDGLKSRRTEHPYRRASVESLKLTQLRRPISRSVTSAQRRSPTFGRSQRTSGSGCSRPFAFGTKCQISTTSQLRIEPHDPVLSDREIRRMQRLRLQDASTAVSTFGRSGSCGPRRAVKFSRSPTVTMRPMDPAAGAFYKISNTQRHFFAWQREPSQMGGSLIGPWGAL